MPIAASGFCRGRVSRSDCLSRRNKFLIEQRIDPTTDFWRIGEVRSMVWLPRRFRAARFLLACISIVFAGSLAVQISAAREAGNGGPVAGSQAPPLPDFAKTVQVRVDGKLISLDKAVRQNVADPQLK